MYYAIVNEYPWFGKIYENMLTKLTEGIDSEFLPKDIFSFVWHNFICLLIKSQIQLIDFTIHILKIKRNQ